MTSTTLPKFLIKAKLHTYAGGGERAEQKLPDGGKEFFYEESHFQYRDRYYGFNPFAGEEVVWEKREGKKKRKKIGNREEKGKPKVIGAMNYYGRVRGTIISAKEIYSFLRKALRKIEPERPFRGPPLLQEGDFEYKDQSTGNVEDFTGTERILHRKKEVYRLWYHGGRI